MTAHRREVHYWTDELGEPPCETLEDGFEWSDDLADVTCEACREIMARSQVPARSATDEQPGA